MGFHNNLVPLFQDEQLDISIYTNLIHTELTSKAIPQQTTIFEKASR